jgi:hypothetical protein
VHLVKFANNVWNRQYNAFRFPFPHDNTQITEYRTLDWLLTDVINTLRPNGHYMYHQFNSKQFYVLHIVYLSILYGSENKQRLFPYTELSVRFL